MQFDPAADPIMGSFRTALDALYGKRLERAMLFGSRARGDARSDSDYDVALFLLEYQGLWQELQPLGKITTQIPFRAGAYDDRTLLMAEIRRDGVDL